MRELILVTGSPRSGTTPVGNLLAGCKGATSIYEPLGPTGDARFSTQLPMPGEPGTSPSELQAFVRDLAALRLTLKPQERAAHNAWQAVRSRLVGTRTSATYRLAKLKPGLRTLVWKDPHAVFLIAQLSRQGIPVVVTVRPPLAHAASYKRMGWTPPIRDIYQRYAAAFGEVSGLGDWIERYARQPFAAGTALWHLVYRRLAERQPKNVYLLNMERVAEDEVSAYSEMFAWLGKELPAQSAKRIRALQSRVASGTPRAGRTHDWDRTAAQANRYWKELLDETEREIVQSLNGPLWEQISSLLSTTPYQGV